MALCGPIVWGALVGVGGGGWAQTHQCGGKLASSSVRWLRHGAEAAHGLVVWGLPGAEEEDSGRRSHLNTSTFAL
jgi:hypothetical protein